MDKIFEIFTLKNKTVKNRIVFPPMVMFDKDIKNGKLTSGVIDHYKNIAKAGCSIIVAEATAVADNGCLTPLQLGIWDDSFIEGLSALSAAAHDEGAIALIQLLHAGGLTSKATTDNIVAPSSQQFGENNARALSLDEIEDIKKMFVGAGVRAKKAGFDGVELHACHGYLLNQFLSHKTNKRDDVYGKDKAKIVIDVIKDLREQVGDDFIISIRMPGNDPNLETSISYAKQFEEAGIDLFHISVGVAADKPNDLTYEENDKYNWIVATGIELKKHISKPVIVVNSIRTPEQANYILENSNVEFVALGKGYLCDLNWIKKVKTNEPVKKCIGCSKCLRGTGISNCVLGSEK